MGDWRDPTTGARTRLLGPLADNGGPTQTMAPLPGSPVIDLGNNTYATIARPARRGFPSRLRVQSRLRRL